MKGYIHNMPCKIRDKARGSPRSMQNLIESWRIQWIRCTMKLHQRPQKKESPYRKHGFRLQIMMNAVTAMCLSSEVEEGGFTAFSKASGNQRNGEARHSGTLFNRWLRQGEKWEKANCFNVWIQRSGRRFKLLPRKVVPEGLMSSCRADMSDTLAQNGHCELWSGRYRTCKKHLRHLKRLDKVSWRKSKFDVPVLGLAGCHSQAVIAKYST